MSDSLLFEAPFDSYSVKPFLIIPIVGAMFTDIINTALITLFLNLL